MQDVEPAQDPQLNFTPSVPDHILAPEADPTGMPPALPAPNVTTLQAVSVGGINSVPATGLQVSGDGAEQHVGSTSMYDVSTGGAATFQGMVGHLVTSAMSSFSESMGDDTTVVSSEAPPPQLTAYKAGNTGVPPIPQHARASGRAGRLLGALLSAARAVHRALRHVFHSIRRDDARGAGRAPATLKEPHKI